MKYTAINIGPVIPTLLLARKPRELWSASYLFSHLMRCIYYKVEGNNLRIISPQKPKHENNKIGIYPDRLFFEGSLDCTTLDEAVEVFCNSIEISVDCFRQYFNVMTVTCEVDKESKAIEALNQNLDVLELCNYAADHDATKAIYNLIKLKKNSPLFKMETDDADEFPFEINTLAEIATARLRGMSEEKWKEIRDIARKKEREAEERRKRNNSENQQDDMDNGIELNEDTFYKILLSDKRFKDSVKSHHKYFCVVQADGDNVGKTVSHEDLEYGQVQTISDALVQFGQKAPKIIEDFGGLPIYAGGDDLLFIAPVIGKNGDSIFDLLSTIEANAFDGVVKAVRNCTFNDPIEASLSFGVSISYYKYPLYEAFESAKKLLFGAAKHIPNKKAVAWSFRKHSGGTFDAAFSLKDTALQAAFKNLITTTTEDTVISAVAHKLNQKESLITTVMEAEKGIKGKTPRPRLDALFNKVLEFQDNDYFKAVKEIMPLLYEEVGKDKFISTLYSLLRTAKFIKGEDLHDEE